MWRKKLEFRHCHTLYYPHHQRLALLSEAGTPACQKHATETKFIPQYNPALRQRELRVVGGCRWFVNPKRVLNLRGCLKSPTPGA